METDTCRRGCVSHFRCESKASWWPGLPAKWILLLPFLLCSGVETRIASAAEDQGPAKRLAESGQLPLEQESAVFNAAAPSPASDARPRGLSDALYMYVGIDLPALDPATVRAMRMRFGPNWLGSHRMLQGGAGQPPLRAGSAVAALPGTWGFTPDNEPIWRLTIRSARAAAVAIRFEEFDVDGEVWVYTHSGESYAGPYAGRGPRGNGGFWSDPIPSDTVTVEYFPRQRGITEMKPPFQIPKISHHARLERPKSAESPFTPRRADTPGNAERSSREPYKDATCSLAWLRRGGHDQEDLVNSVAMLHVDTGTSQRKCSGVLLNGLRESDGTELPSYYVAVLTNAHCIRNQREAVATKLYWKYRTSRCDGPAPRLSSLESTLGARLWDRKLGKIESVVEDYALLLVQKDTLPSGVTFAGWTARDVARGEDVYTLGHPLGRSLRLAVGDVSDPNEGTLLAYSPAFGVRPDYGRTGPGASGSPVLSREDGQVVGIHRGVNRSSHQYEDWVVHKFGSIHRDFRHLGTVEAETQRVSHRLGEDTHWFTFFRSDFPPGWVLDNTGAVESGQTVRRAGMDFVVALQNGRWSVRPLDDHGNVQADAARISLGSSAKGLIGTAGDIDWFRFETSGSVPVEAYTTGDTDTVGRLDDVSDDDSADGSNFRIRTTVSGGTHYVTVSGYGAAVGSYTLHVRRAGRRGDVHDVATAGASWTNTLAMEFKWVPVGSFLMGSPKEERYRSSNERLHRVRITEGFWLGKYEVTQGQWEAVMGTNPSYFQGCGLRCPVESVSWEDAQEFVWRLNERESGSGYRYRLPSEAEWEYAARAGTTGARYGALDQIAWHDGNSGDRPHPVGLKRANAWGLHDMLGNVWEWVGDWYGQYPSVLVKNPQGPGSGSYRVSRGGGWDRNARYVRSADRYPRPPGRRYRSFGIRLVRTE